MANEKKTGRQRGEDSGKKSPMRREGEEAGRPGGDQGSEPMRRDRDTDRDDRMIHDEEEE